MIFLLLFTHGGKNTPWIVANLWSISIILENWIWYSLLVLSLLLWQNFQLFLLCHTWWHPVIYFIIILHFYQQTLPCFIRFITSISCFGVNINVTLKSFISSVSSLVYRNWINFYTFKLYLIKLLNFFIASSSFCVNSLGFPRRQLYYSWIEAILFLPFQLLWRFKKLTL